ncbi:MAG: hypothetical protein IJO22_06795 [Oscillospiraceae bacterium]|nr:hypothetical protein [Oscillospiraceae bacterium]
MSEYFKRAFALSLSVLVLFLVLVFAFELINRRTEKSGFSSGEVFSFDYTEPYFSGEFFGKEFSFNLSFFIKAFSAGKNLLVLLPPFIRLLFILLFFR